MKSPIATLIPIVLATLLVSRAQEPPAPAAPTAEEILRVVRWSQAAEAQQFNGHIRPQRVALRRIPLRLTMAAREVRFEFHRDNRSRNPIDQRVTLRILQNRYELWEETAGKPEERLPAERFGEAVRDTDITYEDMAMRFLYWPDPRLMGTERAKGGDAWKVRCTNPLPDGAYATVDLWVSQRSGALVKMRGYNAAGQLVKSFEVERVQRHKGAWVLEQMNVRTHDPDRGGKVVSSTYLEIEPPE